MVAKTKYSKGRARPRPNPLSVDPTRTGMLRASFSREIRRRFAKLRLRIIDLIVTQDVLGLITPSPVGNALWSNRTIVEKVRSFTLWLRSQLREIILGVSEDNLWDKYITEGFRKGAGRSFDDVKKARVPETPLIEVSKVQFLDSAFNHPISRDKVQLLVSRTFTEMEGITEATAVQMTRVLTDGLVKGKSPKQLASDLVAVSDLSRARAETIARTETIRAFAEGQLDALENLGVEEVGVAVEWSVTKLPNGQIEQKVCKMCRPLEGVVLKLAEARSMLPRHPSCRCAWTPANVGESTEDQKRTKKQIEAALRRSAKAEKGTDSYGGKGWGPGSKIATTRPKANLNLTDNVLSGSLIEFSNWLSSRG
jgi:SPP1 gp7 family putative phage head morphogenesis protein